MNIAIGADDWQNQLTCHGKQLLGEISTASTEPQSAILVGVALPGIPSWEAEDSLDELTRLADTATLDVAERVIQARKRIDPTYYIGKGKASELKGLAKQHGADLIIFDNDLSPAQMRNLETVTDLRIIDRSGLILDIFALHAKTKTAHVQVELAQLNYMLPRLTRQWTHLSRQAGGGVGVRGPGETQLETDRRLVRNRIGALTRELSRIDAQMRTSRKGRQDEFRVALVGYTNAGKSTLMRALSGADVLVEDRLFATLDSTTRSVDLTHNRTILLSDTVGFIKRLPHHLFASFRATLQETAEADLLLHVVDMSHPYYESQIKTVVEVLVELEVEEKPTIVVYNKIDQMDVGEEARLAKSFADHPGKVAVSAHTGAGLETLKEKILYYGSERDITLDLQIPQSQGRLLSQLHEQGEVLERTYDAGDVRMRVRLDESCALRLDLERFAAG